MQQADRLITCVSCFISSTGDGARPLASSIAGYSQEELQLRSRANCQQAIAEQAAFLSRLPSLTTLHVRDIMVHDELTAALLAFGFATQQSLQCV